MPTDLQVRHFVDSAVSFCQLVENQQALTVSEFTRQVIEILPRLYVAALNLPEVEVTTDEPLPSATQQLHAGQLHIEIADKLDPYNIYWEALNLFAYLEEESNGAGDIADDLVDIYCDLKRGLASYSEGTEGHSLDAVWDWKFHFDIHWGKHLVDALRVLHRIVFTESYHNTCE